MNPTWAAVDWGTSNLRLWVVGASGQVITALSSIKGMNALSVGEFEPALLELIAPYLHDDVILPVICCGMVGARQGWQDAGYVVVPCDISTTPKMTHVTSHDPRISVHIVAGIKQQSPADVMRGEETQIMGFVRKHPNFDGVICLPGTHTKWVHISAGEVVSFQTFMTGELFALLSTQSVLRHSVDTEAFDQDSFTTALGDVMSRPQVIAAQLFSLRAASLIGDQSAAQGRARLSGLLIGLELAGARPYWLGQNVAIIGADTLAKHYQSALLLQGVDAQLYDVTDMTLAGLAAAYEGLK